MSKHPAEINDDEIRVISSSQKADIGGNNGARGRVWPRVAIIAVAIAAVAIAAIIYFAVSDTDAAASQNYEQSRDGEPSPTADYDDIGIAPAKGSVAMHDTIVDGVTLHLMAPNNLTPSLHIGSDILADSTVKMIFQAADIRKDNGEIVGAYVLEGNLISKGQSKAGYCAITNGNLSIGVADATPMLEQAIETNGYFFRQYPLVVGGQIVENKPQGQYTRKALAEIGGRMHVVVTDQPLTLREFSQALIDLGASNAIYLVGGSASYGYARDSKGIKHEYGQRPSSTMSNINYIVWK